MSEPEMARVTYSQSPAVVAALGRPLSWITCPCGVSNRAMFMLCDRDGEPRQDGLCRRCFSCGRVFSADGVVLRVRADGRV